MKKDGKITAIVVIVTLVIVLALLSCIVFLQMTKKNDSKENKVGALNENSNTIENEVERPSEEVDYSDEIEVIPTMEDEISEDAAWCPTFQLVWNDMKNELVKKDIEFIDGDEPDYLENLNAENFTEDDLSEDYYYKKWGNKSNKLKEEILEGIKDKFDEDSDIIDEDDDWGAEDPTSYVFYAMLKRVFEFKKPFDILEDEGNIFEYDGKYAENVKYFGIVEGSKSELKDQVTILYYEDSDNFAVSLATKSDDEVILAKGVNGKTFASIYEEVEKNSGEYTGTTTMKGEDELRIPDLKFNLLRKYDELVGKTFLTADEEEAIISEAIQTIKFELDNEGGKIKSEAMIQAKINAAVDEEPPKHLCFDSEFVMFVKEKDKELPYFALKVSDISKFQDEIEYKD